MAITRIYVRRDTSQNWESTNVVLNVGEFGYDTTNKKVKIGDGATAWNDLEFLGTGTTNIDNTTITNLETDVTNIQNDITNIQQSIPTSITDFEDTPDAYESGKRNMIITEDGQIEFVSNNFIVDAEYRAVMSHSLNHIDKQPVTVGEEYDIVAIAPHYVAWSNENGFIRHIDLRLEAGADPNFDDVFVRIDTGGPQCEAGYIYNETNNTCVPIEGGDSIDPTYPINSTFQGVYNPDLAENASGSYPFNARIRIVKSGNYLGAWIDTHELLNRIDTLEENYAGLETYTTATLPGSAENGTLAWNSTIKELVYFLDDGWYKVSDNSLVKFTVIEGYIIAGQSNAGGNGAISDLSSYTQLDGTGTLSESRPYILFSNNYNTTSTDPSTPLINVEPANMTPGSTTTSPGLHGLEISFMDGIRESRTALPAGMKYFINGAEIGKFDKTTSDAETSSGTTNGWDGLTQSIDAMVTWFNDNGYQFSWKGFIWWQGESHNNRTAAEHQAKLEELITNVRNYVNEPELPVCLIQVDSKINGTDVNGTGAVSTTEILEIQQAQNNTAAADPFVKVAATAPYTQYMLYADNNNDGSYEAVHWSTAAHVPIGYNTSRILNNLIEGITEWSPSDNTEISSWYDASDQNKIIERSGSIITWVNNNPELGDFEQGNLSNSPTIVSNTFTGFDGVQRPAVYFDRQDVARMNNVGGFFGPLSESYDEISLFIVARYPTHIQPQYGGVNANSVLWGHSMGNNLYTQAYSHCPTGGGSNAQTRVSSLGNANSNNILFGNSNNFITQATPLIMEWNLSNTTGNFNLYVNGVSQETKTLGAGWLSPFWISGEFTLCAYSSGGFAPTDVEVAEIIVCNSYVSDDLRDKIEGYLAYRWGAQLPSNHPYVGIKP